MSAQYRDGGFKPNLSQYDTIGQINDCVNCPGSCSCNMGERTTFDQMMNQFYLSEVADMSTPGSWFDPHYPGNFGVNVERYGCPKKRNMMR
jgi:hypothetical protein